MKTNSFSVPKKLRSAIGVVATVALLGACGSREDTLQVISFSASQSARSASDSALAGAPESSDAKMMAPVMDVNYVVDGTLEVFGGTAQSWVAKPTTKPNLSAMKKVASALGVKAELEAQSKDMGGGYVAGPTDGTAPSVMFSGSSGDAMGDPYLGWYYNTGYAMETSVSSSESSAPDAPSSSSDSSMSDTTTVIDEPREPSLPQNLPSVDDATKIVKDLLEAMGENLDSMSIEANTDDWGTYATAWREYGGIRSPLSWNFGFGADAEVRYASGTMIEFTKGPKYPQVDTAAGVDRLDDPRYSGWFGYGIMASDTATKSASSAITEPAIAPSVEVAPVEPLPVPGTVVEEAPVEQVAQEVRIVGVAQSLTPVVDSNNNVWLLPSYEYKTRDGYSVSALAIEDKYIDQTNGDTATTVVEPGVIEPGVIEPGPIEPGVIEPSPGDGASTPGNTGGGTSGSTGTVPIVDGGSIGSDLVLPAEADAKGLIGMGEAEAVKLIESRGWVARIGSRDGEEYMLTMDYSDSRITLGIEKAVVVTATIG